MIEDHDVRALEQRLRASIVAVEALPPPQAEASPALRRAVLAAVGDGMARTPGVAATFFSALAKAGVDTAQFAPTEKPRYTITENAGQKSEAKTELFSPLDIITQIRANGRKGLSIQRYKGLGEMDAKELWETTMDPAHRTLRRITMTDAAAAEEVFDLLMGSDVAPRKDFIVAGEKFVAAP